MSNSDTMNRIQTIHNRPIHSNHHNPTINANHSASNKSLSKKRKQRDYDIFAVSNTGSTHRHSTITQRNTTNPTKPPAQLPPKKRQRVKRSSKRPLIPLVDSEPNSHVTITFANVHGTVDAIVLPKQNVLMAQQDALLENKGKLSLKQSVPLQDDIAPQIPIDIEVLATSNMQTIHSRNSFRMGTALFYCSDEERLFWSFPLRNTRRVSCQHYCTAVEKIVTRSVGIHSNKCNGKHSASTPCVYAVCNGKPPKGIIPAKLCADYQWIQHGANVDLLVRNNPNDDKFKKVPNTLDNSTMYSDIQLVQNGPPPLAPMKSENPKCKNTENVQNSNSDMNQNKESAVKSELQNASHSNGSKLDNESTMKIETDSAGKRRRTVTANKGERAPFVSNVVINLKALNEKKKKIPSSSSELTASSSNGSALGAHDYSNLLLHSQSSCVRDAEDVEIGVNTNSDSNKKDKTKQTQNGQSIQVQQQQLQYIRLMLKGQFDSVIAALIRYIPSHDRLANESTKNQNGSVLTTKSISELNAYRLLLATAYFYKKADDAAMHYLSLILRDSTEKEGAYYEARKLRGLLLKQRGDYQSACADLEFVAFHKPHENRYEWSDALYNTFGVQRNQNQFLAPPQRFIPQQRLSPVFTAQPPVIPPHQIPTNLIFHKQQTQSGISSQKMTFNHSLSGMSGVRFTATGLPPGFSLISPPRRKVKSPPNPPIVYVPSKAPTPSKSDSVNYRNMQNAQKSVSNNNGGTEVLLSGEYDKLMALLKETTDREEFLVNDPKDLLEGICPEMGTLERKTTRDELLGNAKEKKMDKLRVNGKEEDGSQNEMEMKPMKRNISNASSTPEPMARMRSDCLGRNTSQSSD